MDDTLGYRDAIHVATIVCRAHRMLIPGEHVGINGNNTTDEMFHGVVDPFCGGVHEGEQVKVWMRPGITNVVRHEWSSPVLGDRKASVEWMTNFASSMGRSFDDIISELDDYLESDMRLYAYNNDIPEDDDLKTLWTHYQVITGRVVADDTEQPFRCCT